MRLDETIEAIERSKYPGKQAAIDFLMSLLVVDPKLPMPMIVNMGAIAFCWINDITIILSKPKKFFNNGNLIPEPGSLQEIVKLCKS